MTILPDWRNVAADAALLFDFDGVLAPIVDDPASATPVDGAVELLVALRRSYRQVALVSGRPREFLTSHVPDEIDVIGLYGLEGRRGGEVADHPQAGAWREAVADVVTSAIAVLGDRVGVESKGLSLTLHYRTSPELADEVRAFAESQQQRAGLVARPAKKSIELHPPIESDKGAVVRDLSAGCSHLLYAGDDIGDLSAFEALAELGHAGRTTVGVAVGGDELPPEILAAADLHFADPDAFVKALGALVVDP